MKRGALAGAHQPCRISTGTIGIFTVLSRALQALWPRRNRSALLLVEDEPIVRLELEAALSKAGHRVIAEARADRAGEIIRDTRRPLAALITGVELDAGDCGWELANLARQFRPDIPVIYLSRFSEAAWISKGVPGSKLVHKPSDPREVGSVLTALLRQGCDDQRELA
jgi:DNA-binding response OmpR family regulator